jgi:hypothetical protein
MDSDDVVRFPVYQMPPIMSPTKKRNIDHDETAEVDEQAIEERPGPILVATRALGS